MLKKLFIAAALSLLSSGAFAACTNPLAINDRLTSAISMSVSTNADGFCQYNFNMAQINGVAPLMGAGATGTGSPRTTTASDSPEVASIGAAADAAATAGSTGTMQAKLRLMTSQLANIPALGQALAAASVPVILPAATITTLTPPAAITGFATAVKQPALGAAGTASVDVLTVQGIASMTPFLTNPGTAANWGLLAQGSATSGQIGQMAMGAVTTAAPSYTTAQTSPLSLDTTGALRVNVTAGGAGGGAVTIASSAVSSGAYAAGALAAGAFAAGSGVDGWDLTQGAKADSVCGTATGTCSVVALLKYLNTAATAAIPAGTAVIGKFGIDQTTPGTTNLVAITPAQAGVGATGSAPPANANYMGALSGSTTGGLTTGMIACDSTAIYDASTTGSTELVPLSSGKTIYVCGYSIVAGGTVNVKLITGTGTACATGSSNKTPAYQLTAQAGISDGAPFFRGLKTASGGALCINASAAVAAQAIVYFAQF